MDDTIHYIKAQTGDFVPDVAIVLGSGLGGFTDGCLGISLPYKDIPGFVPSNVEGHKGALFFYSKGGKNYVVMQGRFHFYEGHTIQTITYPIKVFKKLGVKKLILTNAAGSLSHSLPPGELLLIKDHINFMGSNPLIGANDDKTGVRFPDMSAVYDIDLRKIALDTAKENNIGLIEGTYIAVSGPSYETPAEVKMLKLLGADVVGMSTVPEAIVANWAGIKVLGISLVTNYAAGVSSQPLCHKEVIEAGNKASIKVRTLLNSVLEKI